MSVAEIKKQFHTDVDKGSEKFLELIYTIAEDYLDDNDGYTLSEEELRLLEEDDAAYERGEIKGYTWEEVKDRIINRKGFDDELPT